MASKDVLTASFANTMRDKLGSQSAPSGSTPVRSGFAQATGEGRAAYAVSTITRAVADPAGATVVLARYLRGYTMYTSGDPVAADDTLAFCQQNAFGGLSSCELLVAPDPTGYECDWDENDSWCTCEGVYDCIDMFKNGPCDDDVACYEDTCVCSA